MRLHHAAPPSSRSIWSKCHTPASQPIKKKRSKCQQMEADGFIGYKLIWKEDSGTCSKKREMTKSEFKIWFVPCPFPTLLSWATYSEIFLMASTYKRKKSSHILKPKNTLFFLPLFMTDIMCWQSSLNCCMVEYMKRTIMWQSVKICSLANTFLAGHMEKWIFFYLACFLSSLGYGEVNPFFTITCIKRKKKHQEACFSPFFI